MFDNFDELNRMQCSFLGREAYRFSRQIALLNGYIIFKKEYKSLILEMAQSKKATLI